MSNCSCFYGEFVKARKAKNSSRTLRSETQLISYSFIRNMFVMYPCAQEQAGRIGSKKSRTLRRKNHREQGSHSNVSYPWAQISFHLHLGLLADGEAYESPVLFVLDMKSYTAFANKLERLPRFQGKVLQGRYVTRSSRLAVKICHALFPERPFLANRHAVRDALHLGVFC